MKCCIACDALSCVMIFQLSSLAFASQFMIELKAAKENDRCVTLGVPRLATLTFST